MSRRDQGCVKFETGFAFTLADDNVVRRYLTPFLGRDACLTSGEAVVSCVTLFGASTAFSWFGLLYLGIPVCILLLTAKYLATSTCRMFWLVVCGSISAVATLFAVAEFADNRGPGLDDQLPSLAFLGACIGAVGGVLCFRVAHGLARRHRSKETHIG